MIPFGSGDIIVHEMRVERVAARVNVETNPNGGATEKHETGREVVKLFRVDGCRVGGCAEVVQEMHRVAIEDEGVCVHIRHQEGFRVTCLACHIKGGVWQGLAQCPQHRQHQDGIADPPGADDEQVVRDVWSERGGLYRHAADTAQVQGRGSAAEPGAKVGVERFENAFAVHEHRAPHPATMRMMRPSQENAIPRMSGRT